MIVVFSTSSPVASIAAFRGGELVFERSGEARHRASEATLGWYRELLALGLEEVEGYVADTGPGGFTGTRVGLVVAKTLGFATGKPCAGISAFDLIGPGRSVVPARRGSYLTREGIVEAWPCEGIGYGPEADSPQYPLANRAMGLLQGLKWVAPEALLPEYVLEPSISTPKTPYRTGETDARLG